MAFTDKKIGTATRSADAGSLIAIQIKLLSIQVEINKLKEKYGIAKGEKGEQGDSIIGPRGEKGEKGNSGIDGISIKGERGEKGDRGENGIGINGVDGKNGSPDTSEQIRNKLEELKNEDRLDKSAIKGWEELEKRIDDIKIKSNARVIAGPSANAIQVADLTSQCNGTLKTFTIPTISTPLLLVGMQSPFIYIPTTHYTVGNKTITLTGTVEAPQTGQGLFLLYKK